MAAPTLRLRNGDGVHEPKAGDLGGANVGLAAVQLYLSHLAQPTAAQQTAAAISQQQQSRHRMLRATIALF